MYHNHDSYGMSDHAKRTQRERLGYQQPLFQDIQRDRPLWHWLAMASGIVIGFYLLVRFVVPV